MEQEYLTEPQQQLPPQLSTIAPEVDWIYDFIFWVSVIFWVGITGTLVYFMWKYRRRPGIKAEPTGHHNALELFWTFSPLILLVLMFHWGFQTYIAGAVAPDDAYNVRVRARQWAWEFEHPNGATEDHVLHVPAGRPVRLILSSEDVIHSFFVPDFRVKRDAVPGMFTSLWFEAIERPDMMPEGDLNRPDANRVWYRAQVFCTEYCGAGNDWGNNGGHATMYAQILVQRPEDFEEWLAHPPPMRCGDRDCTPLEMGERLFVSKTCERCHQHRPGGPQLAGPGFVGLFGRQERLTTGEVITVDEEYVRRSIREPRAQIVEGFQPVMPTIRLSDEQIDALITYLRTL